MAEIKRFELLPIPDRRWGISTRSQVRFDGRLTDLILDGSVLLAQHETYSGFLIWVSYEDADGVLRIYLLSSGVTMLDVREMGGEFSSGVLRDISVNGEDVYEFSFLADDRWKLRVLKDPKRELFRCTRVSPYGEARGTDWKVFAYRYLELEMQRAGSMWQRVLYGR